MKQGDEYFQKRLAESKAEVLASRKKKIEFWLFMNEVMSAEEQELYLRTGREPNWNKRTKTAPEPKSKWIESKLIGE